MKRGGWLSRYTRLRSFTPIKARNAKRREREFARTYGDEDRVKLIKTFPCIVCGRTPSENSHIRTDGMSRKADADQVVPLCARHHRTGADSLHALQRDAFERYHNVNLEMFALETDALARRLLGRDE